MAEPPSATTAAAAFTAHRDLLFTIAYEMLGSAEDAEDVLQESWLRWAEVDHDAVENTRAYLARTVARLSLNRLRTLKRRRETYVGPWLPEPVATARDVSEDVELADSVSLAMLVVLESLSPTERAVFVLHEVFGFGYAEIADAVEKSPDAVRQIAHRARVRIRNRDDQSGRGRRGGARVAAEEHARVSERFFQASTQGDIQQLLDVLAPGVVLLSDGGGLAKAALRPILGRDRVMRFLEGVRPEAHRVRFETRQANGAPALFAFVDGILDTIVCTRVDGGVVTEVYVMRNPEKLSRLGEAVALRRR